MVHGFEQAAFEETIHKMIGHAAGDVFCRHLRAVDKRPPFRAVNDEPARFHLPQHGGDGGVSETGIGVIERIEDFGDRRFAALPQHLHDAELEITEPVGFVLCHRFVELTTAVILPW